MPLKIIAFNPLHINRFRDLNVAWLQKYFYVEPKDTLLLENCKKSIIDQGGYIYLAEYDGQVVGCFSFIRLNETTYELGKMAVDPEYQGLNIGQRLLEFAIAFARSKKWKKIVLYSSTKLDAAMHIYRKYGFKGVALEKDLPYVRSDVKMELIL